MMLLVFLFSYVCKSPSVRLLFFVLGLVHCWTHKTFQVDIKNKLIKDIGSDEKNKQFNGNYFTLCLEMDNT